MGLEQRLVLCFIEYLMGAGAFAGSWQEEIIKACSFAKQGLGHLKDMSTFEVRSQVTKVTKGD